MPEALTLDGSHGEGGGQLLRTALALAAATGRRVRIDDIRAKRRNPGLAAQHLTAVRAAAALCGARLAGDALGAQSVEFAPRHPARPGDYVFDVAAAREGGSAGAATLVLQTVLAPLALAPGPSTLVVRGGTHVPWSPPFDYARDVWLPALARLGFHFTLELAAWGWYPAGGGEIRAAVEGHAAPRGLALRARGPLRAVGGRAVAANLPAHIPQRMADRARRQLAEAGIAAEIAAERVRAACPGAGLFLVADYDRWPAGFNALGAPGKASEAVAEEAVAALLAHRESGAPVEHHLADQLVLPLALADGPSEVAVERVTPHLVTVAWVVERFGLARVRIDGAEGAPGRVSIEPAAGLSRFGPAEAGRA